MKVLYIRPHVAGKYQRILIILVNLAPRTYRVIHPARLIHLLLHVIAALGPSGQPHGNYVKIIARALAIYQYIVMLSGKVLCGPAAGSVRPDYLVYKVLSAEYPIHHHLEIRSHAIIHMKVKRAVVRQQLTAQGKHIFHHFHVLILGKVILISRYFQTFTLWPGLYGEGVPRAKRRVKVYQPYLSPVAFKELFPRFLRPAQYKQAGTSCGIDFTFGFDTRHSSSSLRLSVVQKREMRSTSP